MRLIFPIVLSTFLILSGCSQSQPLVSAPITVPDAKASISVQTLDPVLNQPVINVPDTHVKVNPTIIIKKVVVHVEPPKVEIVINNPVIQPPVITLPPLKIDPPSVDMKPIPAMDKNTVALIIAGVGGSFAVLILVYDFIKTRKFLKQHKRK